MQARAQEKKDSDDIFLSGASEMTFGTIFEDDFQARHVEEDMKKQRAMSKVKYLCDVCPVPYYRSMPNFRQADFPINA